MSSRRISLVFGLALLVLATEPGAAERPNVVVFVADDMAWEDCGAYGNPRIQTPHMDRLASDGIRFDRAYLTTSSCSPSRCSMLTGLYPHNTQAGELHLPLPADKTLLTTPLRDAGYWTAAVGKWHLGKAAESQVDYLQASKPAQMGQAWVKALRERPADRPFFLWAAHSDPHRGYQANTIAKPHKPEDVTVPDFLPDTPEVRADLALYYDEVSRFDEHIGLVLDELEKQSAADNTLVVVLSDNGRPFPHCKTGVTVPGVRTPFIVRWPGVVAPGQTSKHLVSTVDLAPTILEVAGAATPAEMQGYSLASLLAGARKPVRQFAFAEHNWHDYQAFERAVHTPDFCYVRNWLPNVPGTPPADAVRSPTYKVMQQLLAAGKLPAVSGGCFGTPRPEEFLFDVATDPDCIHNLAEDPDYVSTIEELRQALSDWQAATEDKFPGAEKLTPDGFDRTTGQRLINAAHPSLIIEN